MKLAEAFAKKTYRHKGIPSEMTKKAWGQANEQLQTALERHIIYSYHSIWEAMREDVTVHGGDWEEYFHKEEHATDFSVYLEDYLDQSLAEDFLDFRGNAEEIVARIRKRFRK